MAMTIDKATEKISNLLFSISKIGQLPIEKNFNSEYLTKFCGNNYPLVFGIVLCYATFLIVGTRVMKFLKPFDLKMPLVLWNVALCLFSFLGMCRTVPYILATIMTNDYESTVCRAPTEWGNGTTGFWVMLFIFSKIPELIDTVFIVLRKRSLIFLHWYHHITVLLFCWNAYATRSGTGLYFVAMNYSVHALMYGYFALQAMNAAKGFPVFMITLSQILQMFIGTGVCISAWYFMLSGKKCHNDLSNLIAGGSMYASYLYLFVAFAFEKFGRKPIKKEKKLE